MTKLQKKFKILGTVQCKSSTSDLGKAFVKDMAEIIIVNTKWVDPWRNSHKDIHPIDLSDLSTWSTYSDLIRVTFKYSCSKYMECFVKMYTYTNQNYDIPMKKWTAKLQVPTEFLRNIDKEVNDHFEEYVQEAYYKFLSHKEKLWKDKHAEKLLTNI